MKKIINKIKKCIKIAVNLPETIKINKKEYKLNWTYNNGMFIYGYYDEKQIVPTVHSDIDYYALLTTDGNRIKAKNELYNKLISAKDIEIN